MGFNNEEVIARELVLVADNDYQIYKSRIEPITKSLERKIFKGIFQQALAEKLVKYLMDAVALKYAKHYGETIEFSPSARRLAAKIWVAQFLANRETVACE